MPYMHAGKWMQAVCAHVISVSSFAVQAKWFLLHCYIQHASLHLVLYTIMDGHYNICNVYSLTLFIPRSPLCICIYIQTLSTVSTY